VDAYAASRSPAKDAVLSGKTLLITRSTSVLGKSRLAYATSALYKGSG
jgi:hypothetical protein